MRISIIGTNGFLSRNVALHYYNLGYEVDMYGRREPLNHPYHGYYYTNLLQDNIDYFKLKRSDIIVYASGAGIQSNLHESSKLIYSLNVIMPISMCESLKNIDYKGVVVTFGSYFELGEVNSQLLAKEDDILFAKAKASTDYVVSKRLLTRYISSYKHSFRHWHFILPTIYGAGENPLRLIPYVINSILKNNGMSFTNGCQIRQYLYVNDVCKTLELSCINNLESGIYNIAGPEVLSVRQVVELIHDYFNARVNYSCFGIENRKDETMNYLALNGEKLYDAINFIPTHRIENSINSYLNVCN